MKIICLFLSLTCAAGPMMATPPHDLARQLESAFVSVAETVSPSVVVITTTRRLTAQDADEEFRQQFEGTPFEFFFRRPGLPEGRPQDVDAQGSGTILRRDGYILTNNHVIDGADKITVRLQDGRQFPAEKIGNDERTDIAVIKVNATDLPAAVLADSDAVKVGQWAIAIGAPFELEYSFTVGHVSAKGRSAVATRGGSAYEDYLQTDAAINPGNSGGPLCDIEGRVIGINTLIRGMNRGIGFAIPTNLAREIADQLIAHGKIVRPWIGIQIETLAQNKELAESLPDLKDGVLVRAIYPNTPAAASELKPADVIIAVDGVPVKTPRDLQRQILRKQIGQTITLDVRRDGQPVQVQLKTGELPDTPHLTRGELTLPPPAARVLGLRVQTLTPALAQELGYAEATGVVITEVADDSDAAAKGLQPGDVITEVNRQPIRTAEEFHQQAKRAAKDKGVLLYVQRDGTATFVVLKPE